jgi:hypothetical protein
MLMISMTPGWMTTTMTSEGRLERVRKQAKKEIEEEDFSESVKRYKIKLREAKWWHKLVPFKILLVRRNDRG